VTAPPTPQTFTREDFLRYFSARYGSGEHVTVLGPTGTGKTTLMYDMLGVTATPDLPAVVIATKPRDDTVTKYMKRLKHRKVKSWPLTPALKAMYGNKRAGYVVWPDHSFNTELDDAKHQPIFRAAIRDSYRRGNRILFVDETYALTNDLDLGPDLVRVWTRGRSMGTGLWAGSQKPTHIPLHAYNQAEHLLLHHDPDKRSRDRYREIGGIDPKIVEAVTASTPRYHYLYIRRDGPVMCIVGP
jgi:energy-coupling factor transporter ATP-binding protein EcfA2